MNLDLLNEKLINPELLEKIIYFKEIDSTNLYAKNNQKTATDNSLILTSFQTKGIGRFGKNWESLDESNLTFSIVKHRKIRIDEIHFMNFYSSYILFQTVKSFISEFQNNKLYLKWPNDIILNGKKTAGMLLDVMNLNSENKRFIIGTGLNINQTEFSADIKHKATSLKIEFKENFIPEEILIKYISLFYENIYLINEYEVLMKKWNDNSNLNGKKISFKQIDDGKEISAEVINIENDGGLLVNIESGKKAKFFSGEISIIY